MNFIFMRQGAAQIVEYRTMDALPMNKRISDSGRLGAIPCSAGVYKILCLPTGKFYVGSTVDLRLRWAHHRSRLRQGTHCNAHLQQAWNKYGEERFKFSVLELIAISDLLRAEQAWLDSTRCANREIGFNIYPVAGSPGNRYAQVWSGFVAPAGNEITITNLFAFCRQHGLDFPSMHRLAVGKSKLKSYKGWTHKNSIRQREYVKTYNGFITPDGRSAGSITNLAAFCRLHGLDKTHMVAVARGRIYSHRGWTYDNDRQKLNPPRTYTGFIKPNGRRAVIVNLPAFCRAQGLQVAHMYQLIRGQRKSHKGWTWRQSNEQAGA